MASRTRPRSSGRRRALLLALVGLVGFGVLELAFRGYLTTKVGPRILLYGTPWHRNIHDDVRIVETREVEGVTITAEATSTELHTVGGASREVGGYMKFHAGETKVDHDVDTGESFSVVMNERGFRGAPMADAKAPGSVRVATLGSSSTFGFYNRDEDTYPFQLEGELNRRCDGGGDYEVLNLGIPHLTSSQVRLLLQEEVLALRPDVVTYYDGINDAKELVEGAEAVGRRDAFAFLRDALTGRSTVALLAAHVARPSTLMFASGALEAQLTTRGDVFIENLEAMRALTESIGATFVVATQQAQARSWYPKPEAERAKLRGVTYADELASIQRSLATDGQLTIFEYYFLVHAHMMERLRGWAAASGVPLVDARAALDPRRDLLVTWVHLHPEGNRIVAEAFADEILRLTCASAPATDP